MSETAEEPRQRRELQPGASGRAPPRWLDVLVRLSDDQFRIPGTNTRFGLDAVIGALMPGVGDGLTTSLAFAVVFIAWRKGAPPGLLLRMVSNIAVDTIAGTIPVVGDWFDLTYRANRKNHDLLLRHLRSLDAAPNAGSSSPPWGRETHSSKPTRALRWLFGLALFGVLLVLVAIPVGVTLLLGYWVLR